MELIGAVTNDREITNQAPGMKQPANMLITTPKFNSEFTPEKGWLEDDAFLWVLVTFHGLC